ncbi:MAG: hypothetical protein WC628_09335 [Candidatus Omnitrophota bacterium]
MKKLLVLVTGLMLIVCFVFAEEAKDSLVTAPAAPVVASEAVPVVVSVAEVAPAAPVVPETVTLKGEVIDNACVSSQTPENLANFIKKHTKQCALKPVCAASGYSIYADGKVLKFDKDSSAKVEQFLKEKKSKLLVVVEAKKIGDELSLVSIKNQ